MADRADPPAARRKPASRAEDSSSLRDRARARLVGTPDGTELATTEADLRKLVHELRVHQVELELQNEELRRAQESLEASAAEYAALYDFAPVGYFTLDRLGVVRGANLRGATLLGVPRSRLSGRSFRPFVAPPARRAFDAFLTRIFAGGDVHVCELPLDVGAAPALHVRIESAAEGCTDRCRFAVVDVTERRAAEDALRESEEKYRRVFENEFLAIGIFDLETARVLDANDAHVRLYGYGREELTGGMVALDLSAEGEASAASFREAGAAGSVSIPTRLHRKKDGTVFPVEVFAGRYSLKGRPVVIALVRDVSERKRAEALDRQLEEQRREVVKAESLSRMAGAVAHHFNNKLMATSVNVELALRDVGPDHPAAERLEGALEAAGEAAAVSSLLLAYLGQASATFAPFDLVGALRARAASQAELLPPNVALETDFAADGLTVLGDRAGAADVLSNLVTNAREAIGERRGTVRVSLRSVPAGETALPNRVPAGWKPEAERYALLEVSDDGDGIAPEHLGSVFDPFFTTKFTGRGLGLAVVQGTVRAHGGAVAVASARGAGSTFVVFWPLVAEGEKRAQEREALPAAAAAYSGAVLCVDDDPQVRKLSRVILEDRGFEVLAAGSGAEALELLSARAGGVRLMLLDLTMPGMDGWQTLAAARALQPGLPVILVSGYDESSVMLGEHAERPQAFLHKPYRISDLHAAIARLLRA